MPEATSCAGEGSLLKLAEEVNQARLMRSCSPSPEEITTVSPILPRFTQNLQPAPSLRAPIARRAISPVFAEPLVPAASSPILSSPSSEFRVPTKSAPLSFYETCAYPYKDVYDQAVNDVIKHFRIEIDKLSIEELLMTKGIAKIVISLYRRKPLSAQTRSFLVSNIEILENELNLLKPEALKVQFARFQELLRQYYTTDKFEAEPLRNFKRKLAVLKSELANGIKLVEQKMLDFQAHGAICGKIARKDIQGISAIDLHGKEHFTVMETSHQALQECDLIRNFFRSYTDKVLDPHFEYFSKFLTAISLFKSQLDSEGWQKV